MGIQEFAQPRQHSWNTFTNENTQLGTFFFILSFLEDFDNFGMKWGNKLYVNKGIEWWGMANDKE